MYSNSYRHKHKLSLMLRIIRHDSPSLFANGSTCKFDLVAMNETSPKMVWALWAYAATFECTRGGSATLSAQDSWYKAWLANTDYTYDTPTDEDCAALHTEYVEQYSRKPAVVQQYDAFIKMDDVNADASEYNKLQPKTVWMLIGYLMMLRYKSKIRLTPA